MEKEIITQIENLEKEGISINNKNYFGDYILW